MRRGWVILALCTIIVGCHRPWYRRDADRETYMVERQHEDDALWPVANTNIVAPPGSRLFDPFNPDYPPLPPDDPAAHYFMENADGPNPPILFNPHLPDSQNPLKYYHRDGDAMIIEDPSWRNTLQLNDDGRLVLTPDKSVEIALVNSREYQQQLENLYSTALALTLDRFEFDLHWFATNNSVFSWFGSGPTELNTFSSNTDIGFSKNFATGGQLLVDFANNLVYTFNGPDKGAVYSSNFAVTFLQPILRNAGARVRLEVLTQGERDVLYSVRSFAHFRKQFYVNLTKRTGFLGLLSQVQSIRNVESTLESAEQNLALHEALFAAGQKTTVQVDQAFQNYQTQLLALVQAKSNLETSLDVYKLALGLPPDVKLKLDDSLLEPFQLVSPQLDKLKKDLDKFFAKYRELNEAPSLASLRAGYEQLKAYIDQLTKLTDGVEAEITKWRNEPAETKDEAAGKRERATREALERQMPEFRTELSKLARDAERERNNLQEGTRENDWQSLQARARQLIADASQLYVVQTQVRVYLIKLEPIPYSLAEAEEYARSHRFDLMNQRAQVTDAWRKIEVAASGLKAGLDLKLTANIATPPLSKNPVDFRASASQYTVGWAFDAPLNRMLQRNLYRQSLIAYQQSRRSFMALDDQIQTAIRLDIRQLETERANFTIARQSLISAARQVESITVTLRLDPAALGPTATLDAVTALNSLLGNAQTLIQSWVNYETGLAQLLLDMEVLQLDSRGLPENEPDNIASPDRPGPRKQGPEQLPPANPVPAPE